MAAETANRTLRWYDFLFINSNWFALTLRSQVLAGLMIPLLVQGFVGESQKGTYFGTIRLWALMTALLLQALFGILSEICLSALRQLGVNCSRGLGKTSSQPAKHGQLSLNEQTNRVI